MLCKLKLNSDGIRLTVIDDVLGSNSLNTPLIDFFLSGIIADVSNWSTQVVSFVDTINPETDGSFYSDPYPCKLFQ